MDKKQSKYFMATIIVIIIVVALYHYQIEQHKGIMEEVSMKLTGKADARGRVKISNESMKVMATSVCEGYEAYKIIDGDNKTYWKAKSEGEQSIIFDLGTEYTIGKFDYTGRLVTNNGRLNRFNLYSSTDGEKYSKVLDNVQADYWMGDAMGKKGYKVFIYFDPVKATHVKLEILSTVENQPACASDINIYAYEKPYDVTIPQKKIIDKIEANENISNASRVLIARGLQIHSWMTTSNTGREYLSQEHYQNLNMTGVMFYEYPFFNSKFIEENPNAQWNIAKAPHTGNGIHSAPPEKGFFLTPEQEEHADKIVSICYGDEGKYSKEQEVFYKLWFDRTRELYPDILVHTNQFPYQWEEEQMTSYIDNCKPDLLAFDHYYFSQDGSIDDYDSVSEILKMINWFRPRALQGIDGTGKKPIAFGQYIGCYKNGPNTFGSGWYESTESQKYIVANLTWASGGKWLDMFRTEYEELYAFLFKQDGTPTHHYYEFAELFRQSLNLGPHLVRLNNVGVSVKPGQHQLGSSTKDNKYEEGWRLGKFEPNPEYHIKDIEAQNLGVQNNGLAGDIVVGYFEALPGIDTSEFFSNKDPKYFMVVNGLVTGNGLRPDKQHGSLKETKQKISITFENPGELMKISRDTGESENVELIKISDSIYSLNMVLGGGEAELFYWQ